MSSNTALPFSAWPTGRKVAAGVFALGSYVALACTAVYLAGVLFLLLNKAHPGQAHFASIVHYWALYADDPGLRRRLVAALGLLNPVVAGAAMALSSLSVVSNALLLRRWRPPVAEASTSLPAELPRAATA